MAATDKDVGTAGEGEGERDGRAVLGKRKTQGWSFPPHSPSLCPLHSFSTPMNTRYRRGSELGPCEGVGSGLVRGTGSSLGGV